MRKIDIVLALFLLMASTSVYAQDDGQDEELSDDWTRENPVIDSNHSDSADIAAVHLENYPFLSSDPSLLIDNGSDWSNAIKSIASPDEPVLRIVHIGDSHIQADMATGQTRQLMQDRFGSLGRGLIVPLRMCGTNEPVDYSIKSSTDFQTEKLIDRTLYTPIGFTGVTVTPDNPDFDFTISEEDAFERLYIYYKGNSLTASNLTYNGVPLVFNTYYHPGCLEIDLPFPCNEISVDLHSLGKVDIYGIELLSDEIGVAYHSIGINGATFSHYNKVEEMGRSIAMLEPHIIIVSLGTNEAFGRFNRAEFLSQVDRLVKNLKMYNPESVILLITPSECQRRVRRKRKTSFVTNDNIALIRRALLDYGASHGVSVYDWYEAAGGEGSSASWISSGLFSPDHIHFSRRGYQVAGSLLYEVLTHKLLSDPSK